MFEVLRMADKQEDKTIEEKSMELCCRWLEAGGPPGQPQPAVLAPALFPGHLGDIQAGDCGAAVETDLCAALLYLPSLFTQSRFHAALYPIKPPPISKVNVII